MAIPLCHPFCLPPGRPPWGCPSSVVRAPTCLQPHPRGSHRNSFCPHCHPTMSPNPWLPLSAKMLPAGPCPQGTSRTQCWVRLLHRLTEMPQLVNGSTAQRGGTGARGIVSGPWGPVAASARRLWKTGSKVGALTCPGLPREARARPLSGSACRKHPGWRKGSTWGGYCGPRGSRAGLSQAPGMGAESGLGAWAR